jgi:hypothetical protein
MTLAPGVIFAGTEFPNSFPLYLLSVENCQIREREGHEREVCKLLKIFQKSD